jgi:hypothetical protein
MADTRLRTFAMWMAPIYGVIMLVGLFLVLGGKVVLGDVLAGVGALVTWVNYVILRRTRHRPT